MRQYLDLVQHTINTGVRQSNRTGVDTLFVPGSMLQFDMADGFPAVTTKRLAFKSVVGELLGFIRGCDSAEQFRALGSNVWDANANEHGARPNVWLSSPHRKGVDDLGRVYGVQWREWRGSAVFVPSSDFSTGRTCDDEGEYMPGRTVDQLAEVLSSLQTDPTNRRMIINAWHPDEFDRMALPPCHVMYQFIADVSGNKLHLCMYQRSIDLGLGAPFNIASCALFLHIMASLTGFTPGIFTHFMADVHVYVSHIAELTDQLKRPVLPMPKLVYTGPSIALNTAAGGHQKHYSASVFDRILPKHFSLSDYEYSTGSKMEMAT